VALYKVYLCDVLDAVGPKPARMYDPIFRNTSTRSRREGERGKAAGSWPILSRATPGPVSAPSGPEIDDRSPRGSGRPLTCRDCSRRSAKPA
jgi:hypothetical protein